MQVSTPLKLAGMATLGAIAVVFAVQRAGVVWRTGEQGAKVWFYDQSEKRLYAKPGDALPPDKGVGGKSHDGVRAIVVAFKGEERDPRKRRIAYLETYAPVLKALLERVHSAHSSGRPFQGDMPSRESDFFQTNTLVRSVDSDTWYPLVTTEAQAITSAWRSWRGSGGQLPAVCVP